MLQGSRSMAGESWRVSSVLKRTLLAARPQRIKFAGARSKFTCLKEFSMSSECKKMSQECILVVSLNRLAAIAGSIMGFSKSEILNTAKGPTQRLKVKYWASAIQSSEFKSEWKKMYLNFDFFRGKIDQMVLKKINFTRTLSLYRIRHEIMSPFLDLTRMVSREALCLLILA